VRVCVCVSSLQVHSSASSSVMEGLLTGKRRIIVLNKADLVPKEDLKVCLTCKAFVQVRLELEHHVCVHMFLCSYPHKLRT